MPARAVRAALAAAGLAVLAACTPGGTALRTEAPAPAASTSTRAPDPSATLTSPFPWDSACDLLDGIDLDALLDEPAGEPSVSNPWRCEVSPTTPGSTGVVDLDITSPGGADDYAFQRERQTEGEEVGGLGDTAYLAGDYLHVLVGDQEFSLVVIRQPIDHDPLPEGDRTDAGRQVLANTGW